MPSLPLISNLESVGVDYFTATAYRTGIGHSFKDLGYHLIEQSTSIGNDVCTYRARDYIGYQSGGVCVGTRSDTHIIRLSSDEAREHWREVYQLATNVSRIDLQLTFKLERAHESYIREEHARAIRAKQGQGRRREIELRWNNVKGDTLYLGSRTSDIFARMYDKGCESKTEQAGKLIRQEIEYKGKTAVAVSDRVHESESEQTSIAQFVSTYIRRFDLQTPENATANVQCARGLTTNNDIKRQWLRTAVRPSIKRLLEAGMLEEVLEALGLTDQVTIKGKPRRKEKI
jgi:DNA relaxase NicK